MRYRNKYNINFFKNPYKRDPDLLEKKNQMEAAWYDEEIQKLFPQIRNDGKLMELDRDFQKSYGSAFDDYSNKDLYDRNLYFLSLIPRERGIDVLELGAGNGILTRFLARKGFSVISIDVSQAASKFMRLSSPNSSPVRACAEMLPFKSKSFDVVTSLVSLHHFNLKMCLKEVMRVLKPGGTGVFMDPVANSELLYKLRQIIPLPDRESPGGGALVLKEIVREIEAAGFKYEIKEFELVSRLDRFQFVAKFQDRLRKFDFGLMNLFPFLKRFARMIVIRITK